VLEIDSRADSVQSFALPDELQGSEGIAYSPKGDVLAVATGDTNMVFLFRRSADGRFETEPCARLGGGDSPLNFPHDVAFASSGSGELLAVVQREGAVAIYQRKGDGIYGTAPVFEIRGPRTRLKFSDGVAFVPPRCDHLAVCNWETSTVSFYRQVSASPVRFDLEPVFLLEHSSLSRPDGLAFSACGLWLALANHGKHTVSIYRRRSRLLARGKLSYGPGPVAVIDDPTLRYPHSVAFTPETNDLVVTNSGANYFNVYPSIERGRRLRWSNSPSLSPIVRPDVEFQQVNSRNAMEGGPKGVAVHRDGLAICNPEIGVKIYRLRERSPVET